MTTLQKARLLASAMLTATALLLLAQTPAPATASGCDEGHRRFAPKNPRLAPDGGIIPGQTIVQATLTIRDDTVVKVVEYPRSGEDLDSYNSTIVAQRGQQRTKRSLRELIKGGEFLRVVEIASLCGPHGQGTVFLAFEAGATGASEGFVVLQYSVDSVDLKALPLADQGGIVVSRSTPGKVELWSASKADAALCQACKKHYVVQDCAVGGVGVECTKHPGSVGPLAPEKFMRSRIDLQ